MKVCFLICSYIYVDKKTFYNNVSRSMYSTKERVEQTYDTIESIREKYPEAAIMLIDNSCQDPKEYFEKKVDRYLYIGDKKVARKAAKAKNKGMGEAVQTLYSLSWLKDYDFIFKVSGRYFLNNNFDVSKWQKDKANFKHITLKVGEDLTDIYQYQWGAHSTVLYGMDRKLFWRYRLGLVMSMPILLKGISFELAFPYMLNLLHVPFCYQEELGVSGKLSVTGEIYNG